MKTLLKKNRTGFIYIITFFAIFMQWFNYCSVTSVRTETFEFSFVNELHFCPDSQIQLYSNNFKYRFALFEYTLTTKFTGISTSL